MTFPVIPKPKSFDLPPRYAGADYAREIVEVPNLITVEQAEELKAFALDENTSGKVIPLAFLSMWKPADL